MLFKQLLTLLRWGLFLSLLPLTVEAAQYPDEAHSTRTTVLVNIIWGTPAETDARCSEIMNEPALGQILGCYVPATHTIYAPEPKNFNDKGRLVILGHEFWHALGAEHPAN